MAQTFSIFPGLIILLGVEGMTLPWSIAWIVIVFVFGALIGRGAAEISMLNIRWRTFLVIVRFIFFWIIAEMVLSCPCEDKPGHPSESIFARLWFRTLMFFLFSFSAGFLQTAILVTANANLPLKGDDNLSELEMCGHMTSIAMTFGIFGGSIVGLFAYYNFVPMGYCTCL
jgi:hypothetical protein